MREIDSKTVKLFLEFIFFDSIKNSVSENSETVENREEDPVYPTLTMTEAIALLHLSEEYGTFGLKQFCSDYLIKV